MQLKTEELVSEKIRKFVGGNTDALNQKTDEQEKIREKKVDNLDKEREDILKSKEEDDIEIERLGLLVEEEDEERRRREKEENDRLDEIERKKKEKMEMEDAARYIQRKWQWFQTEGKFLVKKRKKRGKKGGKKKK